MLDPISSNFSQGKEFREAAFNSRKNYGLYIFLACAENNFHFIIGVIFLKFFTPNIPYFLWTVYNITQWIIILPKHLHVIEKHTS